MPVAVVLRAAIHGFQELAEVRLLRLSEIDRSRSLDLRGADLQFECCISIANIEN